MDKAGLTQKRALARQNFLDGQLDISSDEELLEFFLLLSSQKDNSKELCEALLQKFGSLKNIISRDVSELTSVDGCSESLAVLLCSINSINNRIYEHKNDDIKQLDTLEKQKEYVKNLLCLKSNEHIVIVCLDKSLKIIDTHMINGGGASFIGALPNQITKIILKDKPKSILLAHNHPDGDISPSNNDINFTISFSNWIKELDVSLLEHIIVGRDSVSALKEQGYARYLV